MIAIIVSAACVWFLLLILVYCVFCVGAVPDPFEDADPAHFDYRSFHPTEDCPISPVNGAKELH